MDGVSDGDHDAAAVADGLGELWRFGFEASTAMADRVLKLYQELPSGLGFGASDAETEAELRRLRVDLERAVDLSVDVFERVLSLARRLGVRDDNHGRPANELVVNVEPGGRASAEVWIHNTSSETRPAPAFRCTELVDFGGAQIAAEQMRVLCGDDPIEPGNSRRVEVAVHVPRNTAAGTYHGLVVACRPDAAFPVRVEVTNGYGKRPL